jgi:hypothetical protein
MNESTELSFNSLKAAVAGHRKRLGAAAVDELPYAIAAAARANMSIAVDEADARWDILRDGVRLLSFWPARRHAMKMTGPEFLCKGWEHALAEAQRVHALLHRPSPDRRDLD